MQPETVLAEELMSAKQKQRVIDLGVIEMAIIALREETEMFALSKMALDALERIKGELNVQ